MEGGAEVYPGEKRRKTRLDFVRSKRDANEARKVSTVQGSETD